MRFLILVACLFAIAVTGCDKNKGDAEEGKADPTKALDEALDTIAERAHEYFAMHDSQLPETGVLVYCRGGEMLVAGDSIFKTIGFEPSKDLPKNANFCFNVSSDRKTVALSASSSPASEKVRCLVLGLGGEKESRSPIEDTDSCMP